MALCQIEKRWLSDWVVREYYHPQCVSHDRYWDMAEIEDSPAGCACFFKGIRMFDLLNPLIEEGGFSPSTFCKSFIYHGVSGAHFQRGPR